ncbi:MAG: DbpA RNA binding domain-containing protein, partial [Pseudomonadota bacterium]
DDPDADPTAEADADLGLVDHIHDAAVWARLYGGALIVPVRAKRRTERLLQDAGVEPSWGNPPTVAEIEAQDDARLLAHEALSDPIRDGETPLATALLAKYGAEQVAAAFIRVQREGRSAPEEISDVSDDFGARDSRKGRDREDRFPREDKRRGRSQEPDFENGSWITLSVGRKTNADPKWILPMLCKAGGISRKEIGNIRIGPSLTHVELKPEAADAIIAKGGPDGRIDKSLSVNRASGPPSDEGFDERPPRKPFKGKGSGKPPFKGKPRFTKDGDKPRFSKDGDRPPRRKDDEPRKKKARWSDDDPRKAKNKVNPKDKGKPKWSPDKAAKKPRKPRAAAETGGARIVKKKRDS